MEWDRRELNTLADHAANVALDSQSDWQQIASIDDQVRVHCNWRLCIDGARRGSGNAAAGLALIAYAPNGETIIVSSAGKLLGQLGSAFVSELLALEWGLEYIASIIQT